MEKYGVKLDEEKTKTAGAAGDIKVCPVCGRELDKIEGVYVHKCPSHGTEPFEARP